jgi:hypothetical protein
MIPIKRKILKRGVEKWELDFGRDALGKRRRPFFNTEEEADDEAKKYAKEAKRQGEYWANMTDVERTTVISVLQEVKAAKLELGQVWQEFKHRKQEIAAQSTTTPKAYEDVVEAFREKKTAAGDSTRYVKNTCAFLLKFGAGRLRQNIHEITHHDLDKWLTAQGKANGWMLRTRDTYQVLFSSLWSLAVKNGWATVNIVTKLEEINLPGVEVKIFEQNETLNLMAAVMDSPETQMIIAPMTLGFFGCMRPEEVESRRAKTEGVPEDKWFGWDDIDLDRGLVKVRKEIAKVGDERTIRLQPCAVSWLKLAKKLGNPLPAVNERRLVDQSCDLIALADWIRDGMRKTCATHLRAVYKNDYDVTLDCGNSVKVLLESYAALHVPEEDSLEHWKIDPKMVEAYMKTKAWEKVKRAAAAKLQAQLANENAKS